MTDTVDLDIAPLTLEQIDTLTTTGMNTMASVDTIDLSSISITPGLTVGGMTGASGVYTTTGTGTTTWQWSQPQTTTGTGATWQWNQHPMTVESGGRVSLKGEKADIDINGKSLSAWMTKIEERLNILTPNAELEAEWDELRALGEQYRALEKHIQEKTKVWEKLKSMPPPQVG